LHVCCSVLQCDIVGELLCVAVYCGVLQCVIVCCSEYCEVVWRILAFHLRQFFFGCVLQCVAVCCRWCAVVGCGVLQCVLQCVAVC